MARRSRGVRCQHRHGHTILRQGVIRVFRAPGGVYGCVKGRRNKVFLWQDHHKLGEYSSGSVSQAAGHFLAIQSSSGDQYAYDTSLEVVNLRTGASYAIASESEPISGPATGNPSTPGPWPIQAFVLGSDGRTARLYETFPASSTQGYNTPPSGQVLDVIGFHHFRVQLATSQPGGIAPSSLAYHGHTVTWTQNGVPHSASD